MNKTKKRDREILHNYMEFINANHGSHDFNRVAGSLSELYQTLNGRCWSKLMTVIIAACIIHSCADLILLCNKLRN